MKRRKLLSVMIIGMMVVANASTTFATPTMKYSKESIESYVDEKEFGGKMISQEDTKYSVAKALESAEAKEKATALTVIDESKNADTVTTSPAKTDVSEGTQTATIADTGATTTTKSDIENTVSDKAVLSDVQKKEKEVLQAQLRKEKEAKFTWLTEQGVDVSQVSDTKLNVLQVAHDNLGIWYVWGGTTPKGFDCSGYTAYCLKNGAGIDLPRTTYEQVCSSAFTRIPIAEAKPGDVVFGHGLGHTGIFLKDNGGNITMMHSPETGKKTQISVYTKPAYAYRYAE